MTSRLSAEVAARHFLAVWSRRRRYHLHDGVLLAAVRRLGEALGEPPEPVRPEIVPPGGAQAPPKAS